MHLCLNENMAGATVARLRKEGDDVLWIRESSPGISDQEVLAVARREDRLLITFDKDFGELVFRLGAVAACGIVLFRISMPSPLEVAERITMVLHSRDNWRGNFAVVTDELIRLRALPNR